MNDREAMLRCIELARASHEDGNHPFGSLVILGDEIIEGDNRVVTEMDVTAHAESVAMRKACRVQQSFDLSGATLYTSCEPCWICSCAIRELRISRVLFAITSPKGGGFSSKYPILTDGAIVRYGPPPAVEHGLLEAESQALWREVGWPRPRP